MAAQLIPVVSGQINGHPTLTVDARELHAFMGVAARFNDWIIRRIDDYGFIENQDFEGFYSNLSKTHDVSLKFEQNSHGGRPSKEYRLSLDMAKELAMLERTEKGRMVRRYFIDCERLARGQHDQIARLRALVFELKPEYGVIVRCRAAGLTLMQTAGAVGWGEKRIRLAQRVMLDAGLLPSRASQLSLLEG